MQKRPYREIPVKRGDETVFAVVDAEDYRALAGYRWFKGKRGYVVRNVGSWRRGTNTQVLMHRQVLGLSPGDGTEVDHKNRNPLDNRRSNLRIVSHARNMRNLASREGTSIYRGVSWNASRSRWRATAMVDGRQHHLGRFLDEADAARAVNAFWLSQGCEAPNEIAA